jgi:ubiquinone/menaquinone biosynthesis C-methylase UbiE
MADEALFDSKADTYDNWYATPLGAYADELENALIFRHAGSVRGKTVLDAGCGTGVYSIRLSEVGADVTAVDVSEKMLDTAHRKAEQRNQYVWFENADMQHLPYEDHTFDLVVSITSLEFAADPLEALTELARVLRPGGKIIIGTINAESPWADVRRRHQGPDDDAGGIARFYTPQSMRMLLRRTGTFGAVTLESCLYALPTDDMSLEAGARRKEFLGRLFRPLTGAFLVTTARKR